MAKFERVLSEGDLRAIAEGLMWSSGDTIGFGVAVAGAIQDAVIAKLAGQEPVAWVGLDTATGRTYFLENQEDMLSTAKIERFKVTPLYAHPMPTDHFPDVGKMVAQRQEPVAWRVHPFDYGVGVDGAYAITQQEDQMQAWINKGWEVTPLYLAPTLPLEPSDELIAEIKAMADIRLVDGRVELSNVKEIIHAIVHHPIYAN